MRSAVSQVLTANVENLVLTGTSGLSGTGNELANQITGNDGANEIDGGAGNDTMAGGKGDDTYRVDSSADVVTEAAGEGSDTVLASASFELRDNVENLTLTGTAALNGTGNTLANRLTGNSGNNQLDGGAGADTMEGGGGDDTYTVDDAGDRVTEAAGAGNDTVRSAVSQALTANVENLVLTGGAAIDGTGNAQDNSLVGNAAANRLDGGLGSDTLVGGDGDDTYGVDSAGDGVTELAGQGTDTVESGIDYTLGANLENLLLNGATALSGRGNELGNAITGNSAGNRLEGLGGNDTLDGGAGADTLTGGLGDDTYAVDSSADVVFEAAGEGTDTVRAGVSWVLGEQLENLELTGTGSFSAQGNALDNRVVGNEGNNLIDGGAGADALIGGAGNDTYWVDNAGDSVTEALGQGLDVVLASVSWTLSAHVENLTLTGSADLSGTGNELDNLMIGNEGANLLTGGAGADTLTGGLGQDTLDGGTGADQMAGGAGNDRYVVDDAGDTVTETGDAGTDTVDASVSFTLGDNVENLNLTGTAAVNGTGNELDNVLTGNGGANVLSGGGGVDTVQGGAGDDTLVFGESIEIGRADGGAGNDTLVLTTPESAIDLAGLLGMVSNIETLDLRDGLASTELTLNALSLAGITDSRRTLTVQLDTGDTLVIDGTSREISWVENDDGSTVAQYALYAGQNPVGTPTSYVEVHWQPPVGG